MKRIISCLLGLALLCALIPGALAEGDTEAVNALYTAVLNDEMPVLSGDAAPYGRLLIAVYEDGSNDAPRLSCDEADSSGYHGIPADMLAAGFADAQTVILVYPTEMSNIPLQTYIYTTICVIDQIRHACYKSWTAGSKKKIETMTINLGPGLGTVGGKSDVSMDVDKAMEQVKDRLEQVAAAADESLYRQAEQHYGDELFFTAHQEFLDSKWGDWNERAAACVQPWPENGEVWKNYLVPAAGTQLTIQVNQPEDSAFFARLYRDGEAYCGLFIGGSGEATADLPGGTYSIKVGSGSTWFGGRELFGKHAAYQAMIFDENGTETVELESGRAYTLSINVEKIDKGTGVGSEEETWENIVE